MPAEPASTSAAARPSRVERWGSHWKGMAGIMAGAGVAHFVAPGQFDKIMPRVANLDAHARFLTYASGAAELACAALIASPKTRRLGGWATAGLLVGVFPANIQNALDDGGVFWARLPLQAPLVVWAAAIGRRKP